MVGTSMAESWPSEAIEAGIATLESSGGPKAVEGAANAARLGINVSMSL